ncbi:MAG: hypothetical protein ACTHY0_07050, partial [Mammaliicoccus vitulinus]
IKMLFNIIQRYIFDKSQYKKFKETVYAGLVVGVIPAILILVPNIIFKDMMRVYIPWWIFLVIGIAIYSVYKISKKNGQN